MCGWGEVPTWTPALSAQARLDRLRSSSVVAKEPPIPNLEVLSTKQNKISREITKTNRTIQSRGAVIIPPNVLPLSSISLSVCPV